MMNKTETFQHQQEGMPKPPQPAGGLLEWLRRHPIVVDPSEVEELRRTQKRLDDQLEKFRAMHSASEWDVKQETTKLATDQQKLISVVYPVTEAEAKEKLALMAEHASEFPSKLRPVLAHAVRQLQSRNLDADVWLLLEEIYQAVKAFFLGRTSAANANAMDIRVSEAWNGLDDRVDTEHQAEVAIRFFPMVVTEHLESSHAFFSPIQLLLSHPRAVSFVPIFAQLKVEAADYLERQSVVREGLVNMYKCLLTNCFPQLLGQDISKEFDDEALRVLVRLRELGLVADDDMGSLLTCLLNHLRVRDTFDFFERRLRLLIEWKPSLLMECGKGRTPLLQILYRESFRPDNEGVILQIFELLCELGMTHFPMELGFVFSRWGGESILNYYARTFGTEEIARIVDGKLMGALGPTTTLQSLVLAAATKEKIHLDGVYRLFRLDPVSLIPDESFRNAIELDSFG